MKQTITILLFVLIPATFTYSQEKDSLKKHRVFSNYIKFSHGGFYIYKWRPFYKPFQQGKQLYLINIDMYKSRQSQVLTVGATYERKVYKKWYAGATYMEWNDVARYFYTDNHFGISHEGAGRYEDGYLDSRYNYKMADVYGFYKWDIGHANHFINAGIGASYCWGLNTHIVSSRVNPGPPYDRLTILEWRKAHYWGVVPYLAYDYLFLNNRINIGPDIRMRYYTGRAPAEYDISFHFGVNF